MKRPSAIKIVDFNIKKIIYEREICFVCAVGEIKLKWNKLCVNSIQVMLQFIMWICIMEDIKIYLCRQEPTQPCA